MITSVEPGELVDGRYRVAKLIGRGSMADVYRATDQRMQREVAVKVLRASLACDPVTLRQFYQEARALEVLGHPNVAAMYGGGTTSRGEPYLVVEYLHGRSLLGMLRRQQRLPVGLAVRYCEQALRGLAAVHTMGVHHFDLKPANIMIAAPQLPEERVVIIDFGFAAFVEGRELTSDDEVAGTLSYIAPERLRGSLVDERSDIYSMGIILYEMIFGVPPFVAKDDLSLMRAHMEQAPWFPNDTRLPIGVMAAIERAMAKDPRQRFRSAARMADRLHQLRTAL